MAAIVVSTNAALAQSSATGKTLRARRIDVPIRIDGILDEQPWREADAASDLVQQDPLVGEPVSEATEVRVLVDREAMYFGIVCRDSDSRGVIARELRRDNP